MAYHGHRDQLKEAIIAIVEVANHLRNNGF